MLHSDVLRADRSLDYAKRYNLLKSFEEQAHTVDIVALQRMAEIFWKHSQHTRYGIILLHRHMILHADDVIVQSMPAPDRIICTPETSGNVALHPSAFCLDDDGFFPVEFSHTETVMPNHEFLSELADFLRRGNLVDTLGFAVLSSGKECWIEYELHDQAGTLAIPDVCDDVAGAVVTEWQCVWTGSVFEAVARKKCVEPESGGHTRPPPNVSP